VSYTPVPLNPPTKRRGRWLFIAAGLVVAFFIGLAFGQAGHSSTTTAPAGANPPSAAAAAEPAPAGPATQFGSGTYVVNTDIVPGTYKTAGPDGRGCYWARLKDTSGGSNAIIANGIGQGPVTVTIAKTDGAFETSGCQTWVKTK
jgi:hypothetical protein